MGAEIFHTLKKILKAAGHNTKSLLSYPYAVPEDSVFILGDCRTQAEDSRDFGPVQCSAVKAKVITLIRRRGL